MPMIDAFTPANTLEPDAEKELVRKVTDLMVGHELRRIVDLMDDPAEVKASHARAMEVAWLFVHRTDTYVAGQSTTAPFYKFHVSVPEGQADMTFRESIVPDITRAVASAENGKWRHVAARVWVFVHEVPDGSWGAGGAQFSIGRIVGYVAPGLAGQAEERLETQRREEARATVRLASGEASAV